MRSSLQTEQGILSGRIRHSVGYAVIHRKNFGGDEFAILLTGLLDMEVAITIAGKLVATLAQPFTIAEHKLHIGVSIGISMYPTDGKTQEELIKKADQAMYLAKQQGGSAYRFYTNAFS